MDVDVKNRIYSVYVADDYGKEEELIKLEPISLTKKVLITYGETRLRKHCG